MKQKRKMKQSRNPQKARDIAIGFLGWILLDNIYLLVGLSLGFFVTIAQAAGFFVALLVPLFIISLFLLWKKWTWIGIGIAIALLVNMGVWAILYGLHLGQWYFYFLCPFPAGKNLLV
jgi:hypothetical protein